MKIKVCGMKYAGNIREVAALSPDFMGFIFYPSSKRYVGEDFQMPEIPFGIKKVGVFVNDSFDRILEKVNRHGLDMVQLHGDESPEFSGKVREKVAVIKAFGIDERFDFRSLKAFENSCDYFLFDTKTAGHGGSGKSFDWNLLHNYSLTKPFFLSGGIGLEEAASRNVQGGEIFALDVNSRFESGPGIKDVAKLSLLINHVRNSN